MIALARWGGLRIPSEALALTWKDIDFAKKRFIVRSLKTEHHADGGVRIVPMFSVLEPLFQLAFDQAAVGDVHVITRYRSPVTNLRTQFQRYIEQAGLKPWPKLWQNLRAGRATELADQYPSHLCASWLGHTETIADAYYRMVTDEHFTKAVESDENGLRDAAKKAAQKAAQHLHVPARKASQTRCEKEEDPAECEALQGVTSECEKTDSDSMGDEGLEPTTSSV
ncbi:MAG: site-specific integrase [Phycisphaerales bacterium]